jgi:uncharacterized protein YcfL
MRKRLFLTALLLGLCGCSNSPPKATQEPAGSLVMKLIEQSAASISLAQTRLHETSASPINTPVSAPALPAEKQVTPTNPPARLAPNTGG